MKFMRALALLALLPELATAQTLSVEADRLEYSVGDVITLTITGDSQGAADVAVYGRLTYSAALTETVQATQTQHTSFNGTQPWFLGKLHLGDGYATTFNQICCFSPQPVDQLQIATVTLVAEAPGVVTVDFDDDLQFFGLSQTLGTVFTILPSLTGSPSSSPPLAPAGGPSSSYVVWPQTAKLGETVAVLLDAQTMTGLASGEGPLEVDPARFEIRLTDPSSSSQLVPVRTAIEAPAALGSLLARTSGGDWQGIVLVFDLPTSGVNPGDDLAVGVEYKNDLVFDDPARTVSLTTTGGTPLTDSELAFLAQLAQKPQLRFRPAWDGAAGIDPAWDIHGIEITLRYDQPAAGEVANPYPTVNGEATGALAFVEEVDPPTGGKRWTVSVVDPEGFTVEDLRGSLLDLAFENLDAGLVAGDPFFSAADFTIEEVVILDANSNPLNTAGQTFFNLHAANNRVPDSGAVSSFLAWPQVASLGDTIAVLFNSEADVPSDPDAVYLDADTANVSVIVTDSNSQALAIEPRAVLELPAALGSTRTGAPALSQTGKLAFFELPDPWPNAPSFPSSFDVDVEYKSAPTSGDTSIQILGSGGSATDFSPVALLEDLTLDHMLRLRPIWNEATTPDEGLDPAWNIGALEFRLRYARAPGSGEVLDVTAVANGEGLPVLATSDRLPDDNGDKLWNISLIAPDGFQLLDTGSTTLAPVGRWALVDLLVEADEAGTTGTSVFTSAEFSIEEMRVYHHDGTWLNPDPQADPYFELTALPEPGSWLQHFSGVALACALRRRAQGLPAARVPHV